MHFFQHASIRGRLASLAALVIIALLIVCAIGAQSLRRLSQQFGDFRSTEFSQQAQLVQLRQHLGNILRFEKDVLLSIDDVDAAKADQQNWQRAVVAAKATLQALATGHESAQTQAILGLLQQYEAAAGNVISSCCSASDVTASARSCAAC